MVNYSFCIGLRVHGFWLDVTICVSPQQIYIVLYYMIIIVICVRIFVSDSDTRPEREIVSIAQTALLVHSSVRFRRRSLDPTCSQRYVLVCSSVVLRLYVFFLAFY